MNGKTDSQWVAELQQSLRQLRQLAKDAEETGLQVRLKTRLEGTPGALKDTWLAVNRNLAGLPEEDNDPAAG